MATDTTIDYSTYNPLKRFRTYSYYHVLMATDSTTFVDELNQKTNRDVDFFMHPDLRMNEPTKYEKRFSAQLTEKQNRYVIIANTSTDANIIINSVEVHNLIGGTVMEDGNNITSIFGDTLTMNIVEPFGSRFVEFILAACNALGPIKADGKPKGIDQGQVILVLKTIFVGHDESGEIHIVSDYSAYPFMIQDLSFSFSVSGTSYVLTGLPLSYGFAQIPANASVKNIPNIKAKGTFASFIEEFNRLLEENRISDQQASKKDPRPILPIRKIVIDEKSGYGDAAYQLIKGISNANKDGSPESGSIPVDCLSSISSIILHVCGLCEKMQKDQQPVFKDNDVTTTVYSPLVTSDVTQVESKGDIITTFTYTIKRREQKVFKDAASLTKAREDSSTSAAASPETAEGITKKLQEFIQKQKEFNNLMEYDYTFSGKNVDLINMNMLFEFGLGALYNNVTPDQPINQKTQINGVTPKAAQNGTNSVSSSSPPRGLIAYQNSMPLADPAAYDNFQKLLRRYASFETLTAEIEIMGNPRFLAESTGLKKSTGSKASDEDKKAAYIMTSPFFIKINVFMPKINPATGMVDFKDGNYGTDVDKGFRNPFWYDGLFTVHEITNVFENGKFTQKLVLFQTITDGSASSSYVLASDLPGAVEDNGDTRPAEVAGKVASKQKVTTKSECHTRTEHTVPDGTDGGTGSINVKAFLKTIRVCEGTFPSNGTLDDNGYRRIVNGHPVPDSGAYHSFFIQNQAAFSANNINTTSSGVKYRYFKNYTNHPRFFVTLKPHGLLDPFNSFENPTSAAGAYQIVTTTWDRLVKTHKFTDFTPATQDRAAVALLESRKVLNLVKNGKIRDAILTLQKEWASLGPYYGQSYICPDNIIRLFVVNGGTENQLK